jgi:hypothetical protein
VADLVHSSFETYRRTRDLGFATFYGVFKGMKALMAASMGRYGVIHPIQKGAISYVAGCASLIPFGR